MIYNIIDAQWNPRQTHMEALRFPMSRLSVASFAQLINDYLEAVELSDRASEILRLKQ